MNWRFWTWGRAKSWNPRVVFELVGGGRVHVTVDWPEHDRAEDKVALGQTLASMLFFINDGQLLGLVQQAVAVTGRLKGDERMSEHVLNCLNHILRQAREGSDDPDEDGGPPRPAVTPRQVFSKE